jgi:hypothetical protein
VPREVVALDAGPPFVLSVFGGVAAVGTSEGLVAGALGSDTLAAVEVIASEGSPPATGPISLLARRRTQLLVGGAEGLFLGLADVLVPSPIGDSLADVDIRTLDVFGDADAEELWLTTATGVVHVTGSATGDASTLEELTLDGLADLPDAAVGVGPGLAIITAGGVAYLADLGTKSVETIALGLGEVVAFDRADDGTAYLATGAGLLSRAPSGEVVLRTFAPEGAPPLPVLGVSARFGVTSAVVAGAVISVADDGATSIGEAAAPAPRGVAVDAYDDTWVVDGDALYRYRTGAAVSFAADVAPFLSAHCMKCHTAGADAAAPDHDFETYDVAVTYADEIVARLTATAPKTMPPASEGTLGATDYAVVMRWALGERAP